MKRWSLYILLLCLAGGPLQGRVAIDSTLFRFHQQSSTYRWTSLLHHSGKVSGLEYDLSNSFVSTMNEVHGGQRQWKDDQRFHGELSGSLIGRWQWQLNGDLIWYNDEQSGYFNDSRAAEGGLGVRRETGLGAVSFTTGYKQDIRRKYVDVGPTFSGRLRLDQQNIGGYLTTGSLMLSREDLGARGNNTYLTRWNIRKEFAPGVSDELNVDLGYRKRSYYLEHGQVEDRSESRQEVENTLRYRIGALMEWRHNIEFIRKRTHIKTPLTSVEGAVFKNRGNYDLNNRFQVRLFLGGITSELYLQHGLAQNLYTSNVEDSLRALTEIRVNSPPDDNSSTLEMGLGTGLKVSARDSIRFSASVLRLRYNTPDTTNFDDRDELRRRFGMQYRHYFSHGFTFQAGANVSLDHYAYLYKERSAENYRNRIFRASSRVDWDREPWYWQTSGEIVANYYDYDFDDLLGQVRSLVFRHLVLQQLLRHPIIGTWNGHLRVELQLEDQGRLDWEQFLEELILEREIMEYEYRIGFPVSHTWQGYAGYRYQRRLDWQIPRGNRELSERLVTSGPVFQLIYKHHGQPVVIWESALLNVSQLDGSTYPITQMRIQANWRW